MHFLTDFFKGILIGAGAILPGISSGVLCVIFGIYETLLNCVLNFFKNIKYNFKILFPIGLGTFFGVILLGNVLKYVFYAYPIQTKFLFIGLIVGSVPELLKKANSRQTFKLHYLIYLFFSFGVGLLLVYIENKLNSSVNGDSEFSFIFLVISGFMMSAGVIIPGVSSTLILMLLGVYDAYLISVSSLYVPFLFPLAVGLFIGAIFFMKLIKFLLDNFYAQTFFSIIGFTLGSVLVLYPGISSGPEGLLGILCFLIGFCGAIWGRRFFIQLNNYL